MHKKHYLPSVSLSLVLFVLSVYSFNSQAAETDAGKSLANYTPVLSTEFKELLHSADLAAGEEFFMRKCSSCHDAFQ
ncbi:MAG: hypothetical protein GQ546_04740, partial [Gammaproteobacteria bacterium]|nr:hypothetical protein [Gammaproteobacteria bacterium]